MKERMLTVLVPIKDADCEQQVYQNEAALIASVPVSVNNINKIYKLADGTYRRVQKNSSGNYVYTAVVDREFPYLGNPMQIYNFTYDAERMGTAPTLTAQDVMWYAEKDQSGNDITLDGLWTQECHVSFGGANMYLKAIPTSSKNNDDARYKYELDFVHMDVVLETVYIYDVVQPFVSEKPVSESDVFSFFGDIQELANRINASLLRSGISQLVRKNVPYSSVPYSGSGTVPSGNVPYLTYEQWNRIGINPSTLVSEVFSSQAEVTFFTDNIYLALSANYSQYLAQYIFVTENGEYVIHGYRCKIGNNKYGNVTTSDEKLISFDGNTIHEALQKYKDVFKLQYYIKVEKDANGIYTGNTTIWVADCEYDFADRNQQDTDYERDEEGIPTTTSPFDYGVSDALLSKEKTNTTEKIITRITGTGSSENIPWYYPNPNADGWIKPVIKRGGMIHPGATISYPSENDALYERFLKNRISDKFVFGKVVGQCTKLQFLGASYINTEALYLRYRFEVPTNSKGFSYSSNINIKCLYDNIQSQEYKLYKVGNGTIQIAAWDESVENVDLDLDSGIYFLYITVTFSTPPSVSSSPYYYYGERVFEVSQGIEDFWRGNKVYFPPFLSLNPSLGYHSGGSRSNTYITNENGAQLQDLSALIFITKADIQNNPSVFFDGNSVYVWHDKPHGDTHDKIIFGQNKTYYGKEFVPQVRIYLESLFGQTINDQTKVSFYTASEIIENVVPSLDTFVRDYMTVNIEIYAEAWYRGKNPVVSNADWNEWGLTVPVLSGRTDEWAYGDTIEFQRVKYVTPQQTLMPEVYIKTDGERRFYNAHNYYVNGSLLPGTADPKIGEVQIGQYVANSLYKKKATDPNSKHYVFENEFVQSQPKEHKEKFEDVKPSIEGQTNYVQVSPTQAQFNANKTAFYTKNGSGAYVQCTESSTYSSETTYYTLLRIDIVEEFAFDELDNDEIWESGSDDSGEYKHPFFYAKLRPLGFNIFDMALQDDMVLSMTTGHCGACSFKIGVDENTKKNPVEIWEYDVYGGPSYSSRGTKIYSAGELRRYVDTSSLYYDTDHTSAGYRQVDTGVDIRKAGLLVSTSDIINVRKVRYERTTYSSRMVVDGEVGSLKQEPRNHFQGDVKIGKFCDAQQDTTSNYVWIALYKDVDTYGVIMPSANPDYTDNIYSNFIDPKGHIYKDRKTGVVTTLSDDDADKFVFVNIRLPQAYLRRAEHELSRRIVAYMYDNNYQKFNFSIEFSRIFLAQNSQIDDNLNENSVLYLMFNNNIYRQYVKHYTYRMSENEPLPEISVDLRDELNVTRTTLEQQFYTQSLLLESNNKEIQKKINKSEEKMLRRTIDKNGESLISGNLVSKDDSVSLSEMHVTSTGIDRIILGTQDDININHFRIRDFEVLNGTDLKIRDKVLLPTSYSDGKKMKRRRWDTTTSQFVEDTTNDFKPAFIDKPTGETKYKMVDADGLSLAPVRIDGNNFVQDVDSNDSSQITFTPTKKTTFESLVDNVNEFNSKVVGNLKQIKSTVEVQLGQDKTICAADQTTYVVRNNSLSTYFWKDENGVDVSIPQVCATKPPSRNSGMTLASWTNFDPSVS